MVKHSICANCLNYDHVLRDCLKDPDCKQCKGKHHTLLHPSAQLPQQNNNGPATSSSSNKRPSAKKTPSASSSHVTSLHSMAIQPIITIGPTIVAQLVSHKKIIPVRALLDPCAGSSRICNSLVQSLRLNSIPVGPDRFAQFTLVSTFDTQCFNI